MPPQTSYGVGSSKQAVSCILWNVARLSAVVTGMISPFLFCLPWRENSHARRPAPARPVSGSHLAQERALLGEDELVLFGEVEVGQGRSVGAEPRAVILVSSETLERNQGERDVVGAFMRHPVADQIAAAIGNDGEPTPGIFFEHRPLERIDLVADEDGDGQGNLQSSLRGAKRRSNPAFSGHGLLRGACHRARIRATRWLAMTVPRRLSPENSPLIDVDASAIIEL